MLIEPEVAGIVVYDYAGVVLEEQRHGYGEPLLGLRIVVAWQAAIDDDLVLLESKLDHLPSDFDGLLGDLWEAPIDIKLMPGLGRNVLLIVGVHPIAKIEQKDRSMRSWRTLDQLAR